MVKSLVETAEVQTLLDRLSGQTDEGGDPRTKAIVRSIAESLFATIDEHDVTEDEFWTVLNILAQGGSEFGLIAAGFGFERFLDIRMDAADAEAGLTEGTPRTIEGPLYVAGAPVEQGFARLDDGTDEGELLVMHGQVRDVDGKPLAGALVEVWHANTLGNYSYFDKSQSEYNLRRGIATDADGRYAFRSIMPSGYGVPAEGTTDHLLKSVGRHGSRPAHIHFFINAPRHRHLTTQINIDGDPYLFDDFAYATRDDLIPPVTRRESGGERYGIDQPFAEIEFDFILQHALDANDVKASSRPRALAE